jgi:hypothetical protein
MPVCHGTKTLTEDVIAKTLQLEESRMRR